jgi:hypothetical protein
LSSTEAEDFDILEVATEILIIKHLFETIGIPIRLPIIVRVDNIRAIFLANNLIDIQTHFI